ncbi:T9SS type A sorting domain-containing protein [Flavobacterium sp.]|uniref:T9SS type A sorting domain-containing protein n=1 Tax=Flavobacterium sp. TaxID=239 RepID=UPI003750E2E1
MESVTLFNMIGQAVATWDVKDQSQQNILLPIKNLSSGTYIAKVKTDKGDTSRKIVFN